MPSFTTGIVTAVHSERPGLQRVDVDGRPAYVLTDVIGPVALGDKVVVNTTAVDLGLGSGGWDVVHWNLARRRWAPPGAGRMMKARYTSVQLQVEAVEETPGGQPDSLAGVPVVACGLHSQVACVACAFAAAAPGRRLVYVMTDTAALPLALSDVVADLRSAGVLAATVSCGQAFGGDHEAVNVHSGLLAAAGPGAAECVVVGPGPGVVGTASRLGFGGLEVAAVIDAAADLGGRPVVAVRASQADARPRHRGVSHHTLTALGLASHAAVVAVPRGAGLEVDNHRVVEVDVDNIAVPDITTMGRRPDDDPMFFRFAAAAGVAAAQLLGG